MRLLTILAVAALAAGAYHFRRSRRERVAATSDLERRVRAAIEASVADPGAVHVDERDFVLAAALGAPGVTQVGNSLEIDEQPGEVGTLQSGIATGT